MSAENGLPKPSLKARGLELSYFSSQNISFDPVTPGKKGPQIPSLDAGPLYPSHAPVLVLHVCLIETASLDLGQELTWLYISFHPLSPSGEEEDEEGAEEEEAEEKEEEEKVLHLTCHCGSQDPGYVASEEPRQ